MTDDESGAANQKLTEEYQRLKMECIHLEGSAQLIADAMIKLAQRIQNGERLEGRDFENFLSKPLASDIARLQDVRADRDAAKAQMKELGLLS